jgi:glucose/mannose-6-phosphate isomerase
MINLIQQFPNNLISAIEIGKNNTLEKNYLEFSNVLICGLGGSGIGGKLVANWLLNELDIPVNLCQDYTIPKYVNKKTLLIASSYSGDTEETLSAIEKAHLSGASIIAVTSGGKLADFCNKNQYEYILVPGGNPPRTQLAFSIVQLVHIFSELKLVNKEKMQDFEIASELLISEKSKIQEEAKKLAEFIHGKNLIIYSDAKDEAIAIRARQQFNVNSKILCSHHVIPEMNHNELVGWADGNENHAVLFIHTGDVHPQNVKRFDFSKKVINVRTSNIYELRAKGENLIIRSLYLIHLIDWTSLYLAKINNVDALEIGVIINLKNSLRQANLYK